MKKLGLSESTYRRRIDDLIRVGIAPRFSEIELPPLDLVQIFEGWEAQQSA